MRLSNRRRGKFPSSLGDGARMDLPDRLRSLFPRRPMSPPDPAMSEALRVARGLWGEVTAWSLHPRALAALPGLVGGGPLLILECGSGFSTVVLHHWAQRRAERTRVVSFEHQREQIARLGALLDRERGPGEAGWAWVRHSPLGQVTEASFRRMLAAPTETRTIWRDRADPLPEDLYEQTRVTRAFYDGLIECPPQPAADERLLVILDGPNGSGRSIAFPLLAPYSRGDSFWLIDDWDHYPFLPEMAAVFDILEEQTESLGSKRWKLVRARGRG